MGGPPHWGGIKRLSAGTPSPGGIAFPRGGRADPGGPPPEWLGPVVGLAAFLVRVRGKEGGGGSGGLRGPRASRGQRMVGRRMGVPLWGLRGVRDGGGAEP